jgi:flagellar motor switch protein FliN/FliY
MTTSEIHDTFDLLMRVPLQITAQLGACTLTIEEILKLGAGAIVDLNRAAGSPIDLLVNDKVVARGEIVALGENFGVRITELVANR